MTVHVPPHPSDSAPAPADPPPATRPVRSRVDRRAEPLAAALERHGLLDPARHQEAVAVMAATLRTGTETEPAALRRRLTELAAYVGGAFVVAGGFLFVTREWTNLTLTQRVGLLVGLAVVLALAAAAVMRAAGGRTAIHLDQAETARRLTSTLLTAAAASAAGAAMVWLIDWVDRTGSEERNGEWIGVAGSGVLLTLALVGYLFAPSLLGHLATAVAAMYLVPFALMAGDVYGPVLHSLVVVAVGLLWLLLTERDAWREPLAGRVVTAAMLVVGGQLALGSSDHDWVAYAATAAVAVLGFALYVTRRAWPYLAAGVAGVTLAVPEALLDWTEGSLGTAGVLVVAGVSLLAASVVGFRLRRHTES